MDFLISEGRAPPSDTGGVRADEKDLKPDGPLPTLGDPDSPRPQENPSSAEGLIEGHAFVHCQRCGTGHPASEVWTLSTHPTSEGVVTYFRCPVGHTGFYTTRR